MEVCRRKNYWTYQPFQVAFIFLGGHHLYMYFCVSVCLCVPPVSVPDKSLRCLSPLCCKCPSPLTLRCLSPLVWQMSSPLTFRCLSTLSLKMSVTFYIQISVPPISQNVCHILPSDVWPPFWYKMSDIFYQMSAPPYVYFVSDHPHFTYIYIQSISLRLVFIMLMTILKPAAGKIITLWS